jgi:hypothetical protein
MKTISDHMCCSSALLLLSRLYGSDDAGEASITAAPWTCRAVLQSLPQLAKQYVMRLVCVEGEQCAT